MPGRPVSPRRRAGWILAAAVVALAACSGDDSGSTTAPATSAAPSSAPTTTGGPPRTITVPGDHTTIQEAVDAARTGDLVLVSPGTYNEKVVITTPGVTLRGLDRNGVILDGGGTLGNGIMLVGAGSVVENLTVTGYTFNGVLVTGDAGATGDEADDGEADDGEAGEYAAGATIEGYRVSYVTAYNNGLYGIYAFGVRGGQIDHSYASGHPDSGFYVGQCKPCDVLLTDNLAENNRIGYEGTNAGGNTFIVNSVWRNNRIGITINSENRELLAPQESAVVAGNLIIGNANPDTPDTASAGGTVGLGLGIGGGTDNVVTRNRITGNGAVGVAVTDLDGYSPIGNQIVDNVVEGHTNDLALYSSGSPVAVHQNCFSGNQPAATWPADLETLLPCGAAGSPPADGPGPARDAPVPGLDYLSMPAPPAQEGMPDAADAPWGPFTAGVPSFDLSTAVVPAG